MTLDKLYTLAEAAEALGVTSRFLRNYINNTKQEHLRIGNGPNARIKLTEAQYGAIQKSFVKAPIAESITTGRRRRSA